MRRMLELASDELPCQIEMTTSSWTFIYAVRIPYDILPCFNMMLDCAPSLYSVVRDRYMCRETGQISRLEQQFCAVNCEAHLANNLWPLKDQLYKWFMGAKRPGVINNSLESFCSLHAIKLWGWILLERSEHTVLGSVQWLCFPIEMIWLNGCVVIAGIVRSSEINLEECLPGTVCFVVHVSLSSTARYVQPPRLYAKMR